MLWSDYKFSDLAKVTSFDSVVKELDKLNDYLYKIIWITFWSSITHTKLLLSILRHL